MTMSLSVNIHGAQGIEAQAGTSGGMCWLDLDFPTSDGSEFRVTLHVRDHKMACDLADAINGAGKTVSAIEAAKLDLAWEAVNALGGYVKPNDKYEQGYAAALTNAVLEIEKLGGSDPIPKRVALAVKRIKAA